MMLWCVLGAKSCIIDDDDIPFNVAVAELAGHIPMYGKQKRL